MQKHHYWIGCAAAAAIAYGVYWFFKYEKVKQARTIQVLVIKTTAIDNLSQDKVTDLFNQACEVFNKALSKNATNQQASTAYSLYKQIKEGDADEFDSNKTTTIPEKYNVWIQQAGKSDRQCMLEYILLTASLDDGFDKLVKHVAAGDTKELQEVVNTRAIPGSGLEPPCSLPQKPDNTEYLRSLD